MITLKKHPNQDFVILNLTDIQLSDGEWSEENGENRMIVEKTVRELVKRTRPNLITITGDLSWSGNYTALTMLAEFLNGFGIPWALVWGNHDQDGGMDKIEHAVKLYQQYSLFTYEAGVPALGNGNYVMAIQENDRIVAGIVMMDTHNKYPYRDENGAEVMAWAKLMPEQIEWYGEQIENLQKLGCKHTVLMTHIPIFAYRQAIEAWKNAPGTKKIPCENGAAYLSEQGACYEEVCSYPADEGMFSRIQALGSTKVVIAGHDHVNNTILEHRGVKLVYGLKTGPGCYWKENLNGGTVLTVDSHGEITVHHEYVIV